MSENDDPRPVTDALFRAVIEKSGEIISLTDRDGVTRYLTPSVYGLLGWTREEMGERTLNEQVIPEDRARIASELERLRTTGARDMALELRVRHRDGSLRWIESTGTNLLDDPAVQAIVGNYRDITARKLAEAALRESRDQLVEAQTLARLGWWSAGVAPDALIEWSAECYRAFGIPAGTAVTKPMFFERVHPDDRDRMRAAIAEMLASDRTYDVEHRVRWPDGEIRWVHSRAIVDRDADGRPTRMHGTIQDVTARHAAIEALEVSEARFRGIIEATSDGVWVYDREGITTFANARMAEMLRCSVAEMVGHPITRFVQPRDRAAAAGRLQRRLEGISERVELELVRADGTGLWTSIQANPLPDAGRAIDGVLVLARDVSIERSNDEARARLAAIVESSDDAIIGMDLGGVVTSWNSGAEKLYGYRADEVVGRSILLVVPADRVEDERKRIECAARGESLRTENGERVRKDGSRVQVAVTMSPVRDAGGSVIGVSKIVHDLTARMRVADELHRAEEQLRQAQKMEAVGRLAGGVAHDFNNLLSVILSYAQLAIDDLKPGDPLRDDMTEIERAAQRATALTRQLLAFSRRQVLQPRVLDLQDTIAPMERMLRRLLGEDIALTIVAPPALGRVHADPGQLEQVVMNLAVNARDAMPDGGRLSIELADVRLEAGQLDGPQGVPPGDYVMLAIADTGIGMDAATRAQIFEPFFTTKEAGKGTGLGLSTVFGIVRQSGGHIDVHSELGRGSTFAIYLPRTEDVVTPETTEVLEVVRGTETILLVEDEEQVRAATCAILRRNGYHVLEGSNGGEAFLIAKSFPGKIHLLLTDVVMPRMNGRRVAHELAPLRPDMAVLYMSGYTDDAIVQHGVLEAGIAFIQKPFTPAALLRKVREVLGQHVTQRLPRLPEA